jgi:hypothetical protein
MKQGAIWQFIFSRVRQGTQNRKTYGSDTVDGGTAEKVWRLLRNPFTASQQHFSPDIPFLRIAGKIRCLLQIRVHLQTPGFTADPCVSPPHAQAFVTPEHLHRYQPNAWISI